MTDNLKISFFNNDIKNIHIYICEFIVNNQTELLLETLIELYCDYYSSLNIKTLTKLNTCIDIVKNKNKHLYLNDEKILFNDLANDLNNLIKIQNLYKKKYETTLIYDPSIIINKLNKINYDIWNDIKEYIITDHHKYFLELTYLLSTNNKVQFNNLLNTIINKFGKTKLIKNVETINNNFKECYILIFFEFFKKYKNLYNDHNINNYYDLCYNVFNFKLKKSNINNRLSIIFILFDLLFKKYNRVNYYNNKTKLDIEYINNIYNQLIDFYELSTEIKKPKKKNTIKKKEDKEKNYNKKEDTEKDYNKKEDNITDYLYTIINFNNKEHNRIQDKIQENNNNLIIQSKKPININGDQKIFTSFNNNDINIIKLNNNKNKF